MINFTTNTIFIMIIMLFIIIFFIVNIDIIILCYIPVIMIYIISSTLYMNISMSSFPIISVIRKRKKGQ